MEEDVPSVEMGSKFFESIMTSTDLRAIWSSCSTPSEFHIILKGPQERVHNTPTGGLGVYEEALKDDLHFTLHPFVLKMLDRYASSLPQIASNS